MVPMSSGVPVRTVLGVPLACLSLADAATRILDLAQEPRTSAVSACNTHLAVEARRSPAFAAILRSFTFNLPDGMPLVWLLNRRGAGLSDRVYGPYLMREVVRRSPPAVRHLFIGGTPDLLDRLVTSLRTLNPGLNVTATLAPPFGEWSDDDRDALTRAIRDASPDLIWVALGGVRQETWIARERTLHTHGVFLAVGDAFPLLAGLRPFAPEWMQKAGLTWLYRLIQEPRRLWKRYLVHNLLFLRYALTDPR
jgi:N-acetylglucosaminyldiphosphoundecaprenol N-acetyl-beta-D-mannosaminyltransferase